MKVELFGSQGSRSPLVNWYLHELNVPFEMAPRERNPHPFGQIPCLKDGSNEVFESGAILIYLAQKYGGLTSADAMAAVVSWVVWANASLDPLLFLENERGQVIGTRLTQNPKGIQVRRERNDAGCGPRSEFTDPKSILGGMLGKRRQYL
jgi:glutathione S-transferase